MRLLFFVYRPQLLPAKVPSVAFSDNSSLLYIQQIYMKLLKERPQAPLFALLSFDPTLHSERKKSLRVFLRNRS